MTANLSLQGMKLRWNGWTSWAGVAVVAVVLGLLAPQLIPGEPAVETSPVKAEVKEKGKLEYASPTLPDVPSPQGMFVRLGVGTCVVLGLCASTLWGIRRWLYPKPANGSLPREMRLMETLQLGSRCALHLVHLGKQPILVGVDAGGIKTIVPLASTFDDILADADKPLANDEPIAALKIAA